MEFIKKSSSVTDIVIPEGDVIRITEKDTGRVLWEKKRDLAPNAKWISRKLLDYWSLATLGGTVGGKISCIALDTYKSPPLNIRIGYVNSYNDSCTFTSYGTLTKYSAYWHHSTVATNYAGKYATNYVSPARALSISDDGLMTFFYSNGSYAVEYSPRNTLDPKLKPA